MIDSRRLLVIAMLVAAPLIAACSTPTGNDDPSNPNPPADSTGFKETKPWG
jgi:hypothetical protein